MNNVSFPKTRGLVTANIYDSFKETLLEIHAPVAEGERKIELTFDPEEVLEILKYIMHPTSPVFFSVEQLHELRKYVNIDLRERK